MILLNHLHYITKLTERQAIFAKYTHDFLQKCSAKPPRKGREKAPAAAPLSLIHIFEAVRALGIPCEATGRNDLAVEGRKFSGNAFRCV